MKDWLKHNEILSPLRKGQSGSSINTIAVHSGWCFCFGDISHGPSLSSSSPIIYQPLIIFQLSPQQYSLAAWASGGCFLFFGYHMGINISCQYMNCTGHWQRKNDSQPAINSCADNNCQENNYRM